MSRLDGISCDVIDQGALVLSIYFYISLYPYTYISSTYAKQKHKYISKAYGLSHMCQIRYTIWHILNYGPNYVNDGGSAWVTGQLNCLNTLLVD